MDLTGKMIMTPLLLWLAMVGCSTSIQTTDRSAGEPSQYNVQNTDSLPFRNEVYSPDIASVKLYRSGDPISLPIIRMRSGQTITLEFDDFDTNYKRYTYSVVHCNRDWRPSELLPSDYLTEFEEEEIEQYNPSLGTYVDYIHYRLVLPNRNFGWNKSGNYALLVFDESGVQVICRRFVVVDQLIDLRGEVRRPTRVGLNRSHHEILFSANIKDVELVDPLRSVTAEVYQNLNWDIKFETAPRRITGDWLYFDHHNHNVLPAGKPYRLADLRSIRYRGPGVFAINVEAGTIWVTMETDLKRLNTTPSDDRDLNGGFVIENSEFGDAQHRSEYLSVLFTLESHAPYFDREVYLLGAFNDFHPSDEFKMTYNDEHSIYELEVWLKQGVYDYYYATTAEAGDIPDWSDIEGNWYETTNLYTILLYYRPFGAQYDAVIGSFQFKPY